MRRTIWTGLCGAIIGATTIALAAQTSSTPQAPQTSASADQRITVTGCLKAAPSTATDTTAGAAAGVAGTSGTTGATGSTDAAAANEKFVLTNATPSTPDAAAAGAAASTSAADAPKAAAAPAQTYRLVANPTALSPHVGKKLELTGTLQDEKGSPASASSGAASAMNGPALKVESGKVVAASCSE